MKQLFLNRWNARERGSSLSFAVLLAMAAMMLSPQKAWADIDVEFSGYADGVITANYDGDLEATVPPTTYDLSVAGVQVTSENALSITGENITGSVSFDAQTNTLTLDDATIIGSEIGGGCILSGLSSLTVKLMGKENQIVSNDSCTAIRATASGNQSLTITADANSMLTITAARIIRDFNSLNVAENLKWSSEYVYGVFTTDYGDSYALYITGAGEASGSETPITQSNIEYYHLFIGETQVTSENIQEFEGVSFSEGILTLENAYYDDVLQTSLAELTIKVIGSNNHFGGIRYSGQYETSTLTFIKDEQSEGVCSLTLNGSYNEENPIEESAISGFTSVNYGTGMSLAAAYGTEYSERGYLYNSTISSYVEYIYDATITSADVYQLWYNSEQVTSENAATLEKSYDDNSVTASFDGKTSTLTFNNLGGGYGGHAVISNMENLNVYLIGENSMSGESQSFFYTPSQSAKINFQTSDDAPGSLTMYSMGVPFEGFVEANIIYENDLKYTLTPQYSADDLSVVENYTATIQVPPYGLIVYTEGEPNGVQVTKENRTNVLGEDQPTVQFDGRNRLILNNAQLTRIVLTDPSFLPIVDDQQQLTGMEIYLKGVSTVTCSEGYAIQSQGATAAVQLDFLTGADKPGTLKCTGTEDPFQGFDVTYKYNLTLTQNSMTATVETPLLLIVENTVDDEVYIFNSNPAGSDNAQLQNFISTDRKVLFTLGDYGVPNKNDDGYDQTRNAIIFNYVTTDTDVAAINTDEKVPGTPAYAGAFTGITFIVPAGTGTIKLRAHTETDATGYYAFHVMVGNQVPVEVVNTSGNDWIEVPYACTTDSYVKVYLVYVYKSSAPMMASHRIGPKSHVSGGLGGMSVSSSLVCSTDAQAVTAPYKIMAAGDWNKTESHITVSASDVTDMADNAFGFAGSSAPAMNARRASADHVTYIDCSKTSITGKNFTRTEGAFQGVPEETLIYLPAGNTAVGKNFVIGGICENMKLDADLEADFELTDEELTAARAEFTREFNKSTGAQNCYTVYLPYEMNVSNLVGQFFEFSSYNETEENVVMTEVSADAADMLKLEANKAYLFRPSGNGKLPAMNGVTVKMPVQVSNPSAATEAEGMHGVYKYHKWTTAPDNIYCYSASAKDDIKAGQFAKVGKDTFIRPFRAYLRLNTTSAPEYLSVNWGDGTTSIVPIDKTMVQQDADGWFTISGFRLPDKPSKQGVYIHNGKKIVMK